MNWVLGAEYRVDMGLYWHTGRFAGYRAGDRVEMWVHASKQHGEVVLTDTDGFSDGRPIVFFRAAPTGQEWGVVERMLEKLGEPYHLFFNNCEHVSSEAETGTKSSPSLLKWLVGLGATAVVGAGVAAANAPVEDANGRLHSRRTGRYV